MCVYVYQMIFLEACVAFASTCTVINVLIPTVHFTVLFRDERRRKCRTERETSQIQLYELHAEE